MEPEDAMNTIDLEDEQPPKVSLEEKPQGHEIYDTCCEHCLHSGCPGCCFYSLMWFISILCCGCCENRLHTRISKQ